MKASFSEDWAEAPISADFWTKFWEAVAGPSEGYDALTITQAIASLGGAVDESFGPLAEQCANAHPGADDAGDKTVPGLLSLQGLSECPTGSLGHDLYCLLSANGFDPEVLDRNAIMLSALPPALQYLNTRILQMHDVWHFGRRLHDRLHTRGCDLVIPTRPIWAQLLGDVSSNRRANRSSQQPSRFSSILSGDCRGLAAWPSHAVNDGHRLGTAV